MIEKWMFLSVQETEKKLNTSAAFGLTRKAARGRLQKAGENAFFLLPRSSFAECVREVIAQPSLVLLLALSILLMFFEEQAQGKLLLGMILLYAMFLIIIRLWTGQILCIPAKTALPLIRVIREGKLYMLDSARLVPGDLIELESGDIVPCDLRLVSSTDVSVLTYLGELHGEEQYVRSLKNGNYACDVMHQNDIAMHSNMLYGGSVIEKGTARALVVETGKHTYIGALQGGYPLKTSQTLPEHTAQMKKTAALFQIVLLLAVLPMFVLCLLIGKNEESLPVIFSALLCLCLANLAGNMETWFRFSMAMGVYRALFLHPRGERALLRTNKTTDRLLDFDELFLLGPQAFSEKAISAGADVRLPSAGGEHEEISQQNALALSRGEHFLLTREDGLKQLRAAGIRPILFLEDSSKQALTYILQTGITQSVKEIAMADRFHQNRLPITHGWGRYHAYCGFSHEEIRELLIYLHRLQHKVAVFANLPREYALLKHADVRFAGVDDLDLLINSDRTREKSALSGRGREDVATQRMRQQADVLIPCADRHRGGVSAVVHTLRIASILHRNLITLACFCIYTQVVRTILTLPILVGGLHPISALQIVFSGLIADFVFACLLILRIGDDPIQRSFQQSQFSRTATLAEAILASVMTLTAFLFMQAHVSVPSNASSALFAAMLSIQMTSFLMYWNIPGSIRHRLNCRNLLVGLGLLGVLALILGVFGQAFRADAFPMIGTSYGYLLLIAPMSVICSRGIIKLYRIGRFR